MQHPNKNRLLEYFYNEVSEHERLKIRKHLFSCSVCEAYIKTLEYTAGTLNQLADQSPLGNTFELIQDNILISPQKSTQKKQIFSAMPFFQIALSIPFILAIIYFIQSKLSLLPIWETMQNLWIFETIGSFGAVLVFFFCLGSFITLSIAPILLFDSEKNNHLRNAF